MTRTSTTMGALTVVGVLLAFQAAALADDFSRRVGSVPNPREISGEWVYDGVGLLGDRKGKINAEIDLLERETTAEISVVVLHTIGDNNPKDFATALFNVWGVGKKGKDNGVLVLHVVDRRRIEIETGYGMESILTDARCQWIIDGVAIPFFRQSSFADGHLEIVRSLARGIRNGGGTQALLTGDFEFQPGVRVDEVPGVPVTQQLMETSYTIERHPPMMWMLVGGLALWVLWLLIYGVFRLVNRAPYARHRLYNVVGGLMQWGGTGGLGGGMALTELIQNDSVWSLMVGGVGSVGLFIRRSRHLLALRNAERKCEKCSAEMDRLDERADDAYLEGGQVSEEGIESMDYDVWKCGDCGHHQVEAYKGDKPAKKCPRCSYKTYRVTSQNTVRAATYSSSGLMRITSRCAHCSHHVTVSETIPQMQRPSTSSSSGSSYSSGSSSSGGSSGGSSYGGGSSGGGGAGGSY